MSRLSSISAIFCFAIFAPVTAFSAVINVPSDQPTIQSGISAAATGDTVLVAPGIYTGEGNRDIDFSGKSVVLLSAGGPDVTIIDCQGSSIEPHRAFYFHNGEDTTSTINGLTIKNGYNTSGGAIYCRSLSFPIFNNCVFENNIASGSGGVSSGFEGSPRFRDCTFLGNQADYGGALIYGLVWFEVTSCLFKDNNAIHGGAISAEQTNPNITQCVFIHNTATEEGGSLYIGSTSNAKINACTFYGDSAQNGASIYCDWFQFDMDSSIISFSRGGPPVVFTDFSNSAHIRCCDIYGNIGGDWIGDIADMAEINGNFSANPLYCNTAGDNYHISSNSPCAPENNTCGNLIGAMDVACDKNLTFTTPDVMRAADAHTYGTALACIGIYSIENGYSIYDIDTSTLMINDSISPIDFEYLTIDPIGEVIKMSFPISEFVMAYMPLWDTSMQMYTISGQFNDFTDFSTLGWVKMIGHRSGDTNGDGMVNIFDITYLIAYLYLNGPRPLILESVDVNGDGEKDIFDVTYLVSYLYLDGPEPACP